MRKYIQNEDDKLAHRDREFKNRLDKIQENMDHMAETVVQNERDKRLQEERRLLDLQNKKAIEDSREEEARKERIRLQNIEINKYLQHQMEERVERKHSNVNHDKELQIALLEKNNKMLEEDKKKNNSQKQSLLKNKEFLVQQAETKKNAIDRDMDEREVKINKDLLNDLKVRNLI